MVLGVLSALLAVLPIGYLLARLAEGWEDAVSEVLRPRTLELLSNSLLLVAAVSVTALAIGVFQAWFLIRARIPFTGFFALLATVPLAIPSYVLALGYISIFPGFSGFWASWLVLSVATSPYVFLAVAASLVRMDVKSEEVARSLGRNQWQVFWQVTWPQIRLSASGATLLVALYVLSEFGAIALLRFDTFTRAIYNAYRASFDRTAAASLAVMLLLLTLLILLLERRNRGSYLQLSPLNYKRNRIDSKLTKPVVLILTLLGVLSTFIPVAALVFWSAQGTASFDFENLLAATGNSILVSALAAIVIGLVGLASAIWFVLHSSKFSKLVESVIWANHALPAVVVGLALVFIGANFTGFIYQSLGLLIIGYAILFLPNALVAMSTPLSQVPAALSEVARSLGNSYRTTLQRVVLPVATPGLVAGFALIMLTVIKELPLTLLLRPTGVDTLATRMWQATEELAYSQAAPYALMLIVIAGLPALALNASVRRAFEEVGKK